MGVTAAVMAAVVAAAGTTASLVEQNQQVQHAKGAAQAQETAMNGQAEAAKKQDADNLNKKQVESSATQQAAMAALRASMSANSGMGGTILTGGQGAAVAPVTTKSLLGG